MAAPPPARGGNAAGKSFLHALTHRPTPLNSKLPSNPEIIPKTLYKGDIACLVTRKEAEVLASHYDNALVGKFARGKPSMIKLNEAFKSVGFKGSFQLGSLDFRHVLIRFQEKEDYQRFWLKGYWIFLGAQMKVLKWTMDFSPEAESSIVPVWINIPHVPVFFYNTAMIKSMGNQIGNFLKMDAATEALSRPSAVKLCVEIDLRKKQPTFIRVGIEEDGVEYNVMKLPLEFEELPLYCYHCKSIGHDDNQCIYLHPELKRSKPFRKEQPSKDSLQLEKDEHEAGSKMVNAGSSGVSPQEKLLTLHSQEKSHTVKYVPKTNPKLGKNKENSQPVYVVRNNVVESGLHNIALTEDLPSTDKSVPQFIDETEENTDATLSETTNTIESPALPNADPDQDFHEIVDITASEEVHGKNNEGIHVSPNSVAGDDVDQNNNRFLLLAEDQNPENLLEKINHAQAYAEEVVGGLHTDAEKQNVEQNDIFELQDSAIITTYEQVPSKPISSDITLDVAIFTAKPKPVSVVANNFSVLSDLATDGNELVYLSDMHSVSKLPDLPDLEKERSLLETGEDNYTELDDVSSFHSEPENTYDIITSKLSREKFKQDMIRFQHRLNGLILKNISGDHKAI